MSQETRNYCFEHSLQCKQKCYSTFLDSQMMKWQITAIAELGYYWRDCREKDPSLWYRIAFINQNYLMNSRLAIIYVYIFVSIWYLFCTSVSIAQHFLHNIKFIMLYKPISVEMHSFVSVEQRNWDLSDLFQYNPMGKMLR